MLLLILACQPEKTPTDTQIGADSPALEDSPVDSPIDSPIDTGPVDADGDGWIAAQDCDDGDPTVNPAATERCGGGDEDCDGQVDEAGAEGEGTWYSDLDHDGWGLVEKSACTQPPETTDTPGDCNDADPDIHPGQGCDYVLVLDSPGASQVFLVSPSGGVLSDGSQTWTLAAGDAVELSLSTETRVFRSEQPFLAHAAFASDGGDMVSTALGPNGSPRHSELTVWSAEHVQVFNPTASPVTVTLERWEGAWTPQDGATLDPGAWHVFSGSRGLYRLSGSDELLASGWMVHNIENHFETVPSLSGSWLGEGFAWRAPEVIGQVGVVGTCMDTAGCEVTVSLDGSTASWSLAWLDSFRQLTPQGQELSVTSQGTLLLRDESTPYGWDASDGTCMDTDLAPSVEGARYGKVFVLPTTAGTASGYPARRMDLVALVYVDHTTVALERWDGAAWVAEGSWTGDAGEALRLTTDEPSGGRLRVAATEDIHLHLQHTGSEYAWAVYSDHFADR